MEIRLKKLILSCIAILILAALSIPDVAKISHAIFEHKEQTCLEKGKVHFHETEFDCNFHKFHITTYFFPETFNFTLVSSEYLLEKNQNFYFLLSEFQKLHFSLRGPPENS